MFPMIIWVINRKEIVFIKQLVLKSLSFFDLFFLALLLCPLRFDLWLIFSYDIDFIKGQMIIILARKVSACDLV